MISKIVQFIVKSLLGSALIYLYIYCNTPISYPIVVYGISLGGAILIFSLYEIVTKLLVKRVRSKFDDEE